ncbi:MAG: hypothetical protein R3E77_05570 [Steroidobacteraceae bacterium]
MAVAEQSALPTRAILRPDGLYVAVRDIPASALRDPFMQQTVERMSAVDSLVHVTPDRLAQATPMPEPAGLIFHVARCGSTLVSQMLKECANLVVYSEPGPFNELLLPPPAVPRAQLVTSLRALGGLFARHAGSNYVIKFSSWNTLFCDLLAEAFPSSPWLLCLRDPIEVAVSLARETPAWIRAGSEPARRLAAVVDPQGAATCAEDYIARVYGAFCVAAARLPASRGWLLHYEELPQAVWQTVAGHFSLAPDTATENAMRAVSRLYSKAPVGSAVAFDSDSVIKRSLAAPVLRDAVARYASPQLLALEAQVRGIGGSFRGHS